jgi:hypothetical protein
MTAEHRTRDPGDRTDPLEAILAAARAAPPEPPAGLVARVLADADAHAPAPRPPAVRSAASGLWSDLAAMLGGWRGMGGLATAAAAGLWIGYSGIVATGLPAGPSGTVELLPETGFFDSDFALEG